MRFARPRLLAGTSVLALLTAAVLAVPPAPGYASDEAAFKELKAEYEKWEKNRDDIGNRERRKTLLKLFDFRDLKSCRKLLRDAYGDEFLPDHRVAVVQLLGATGDAKEIEFLLSAFKKERAAGPVIALGEGIGFTDESAAADASKSIATMLGKHKGEPLRSLIEGVGQLGQPEAMPALVALGDKLPSCEAFERLVAIGACGKALAVPVLERAAKSVSADMRLAAATGLARTGADEATPHLVGLLADNDPRVVEEAARALGEKKHAPARDALADALPLAPLRVKETIREALKAIVGKDCGHDPAAWKVGAAAGLPKPFPLFAGTQIPSDRVVLLLDPSRSMAWKERLERAKDELKRYLAALGDGAQWNVVVAAGTPTVFGDRLTFSPSHRQDAVEFIDKQHTSSKCDLREAMQWIFRTNPDADTVVYVTDSYPFGESSEDTPLSILQEIRKENRLRRVRVFVAFIAPGGRDEAQEIDAGEYDDRKVLLQQFAEMTGGKFVAIEQ